MEIFRYQFERLGARLVIKEVAKLDIPEFDMAVMWSKNGDGGLVHTAEELGAIVAALWAVSTEVEELPPVYCSIRFEVETVVKEHYQHAGTRLQVRIKRPLNQGPFAVRFSAN